MPEHLHLVLILSVVDILSIVDEFIEDDERSRLRCITKSAYSTLIPSCGDMVFQELEQYEGNNLIRQVIQFDQHLLDPSIYSFTFDKHKHYPMIYWDLKEIQHVHFNVLPRQGKTFTILFMINYYIRYKPKLFKHNRILFILDSLTEFNDIRYNHGTFIKEYYDMIKDYTPYTNIQVDIVGRCSYKPNNKIKYDYIFIEERYYSQNVTTDTDPHANYSLDWVYPIVYGSRILSFAEISVPFPSIAAMD